MCLRILVCLVICVRVHALRPRSAAARVCDSNGLKRGIQACKWSHLNLGPFPTYLQGHPILYLENHFDTRLIETRPYGAPGYSGTLWTIRRHPDLPYIIFYPQRYPQQIFKKPFPDADTEHKPPPILSVTIYLLKKCSIWWDFWHLVLPDSICCFRTVNHLPAWVLLSRLTLTWNIDPSLSSILNPQTIHTKDISCWESYNVLWK